MSCPTDMESGRRIETSLRNYDMCRVLVRRPGKERHQAKILMFWKTPSSPGDRKSLRPLYGVARAQTNARTLPYSVLSPRFMGSEDDLSRCQHASPSSRSSSPGEKSNGYFLTGGGVICRVMSCHVSRKLTVFTTEIEAESI